MRREMFEEDGIKSHYKLTGVSKKLLSYDLPKEIINFVWNGRYVGQKQRWFFCKFIGEDSMINLNTDQNPEFYKWKWVEPNQLPEIIVDFKKKMYVDLLKILKSFID